MNRRTFAFAMALTTMLFSVMAVEPASAQRSIKGGGGGGISGGGGKRESNLRVVGDVEAASAEVAA